MKNELLSPAGNINAFYAAISNGADAIYVGLNQYSARAYANNFTFDELAEITKYAHLRNVKIYVAMNTIVLEVELESAYLAIDELAKIGVDALIIQDLSLVHYVTNRYPNLEAHLSTQVGIDDLEGVRLAEKLNVKRVVMARETPISVLNDCKKHSKMELETFIHGALCVSYSGNCFMSGLLGMRSGNRGRCVGCCRKLYGLYDETTNTIYPRQYLLNMKDLNTSRDIKQLKNIDSFKIEGRMKEASYVAGVTRYYRDLLDGKIPNEENINKNFHRTFTKGYGLGDDPKTITNLDKPNNFGYLIGKVHKINGKRITIKLNSEVNQNDQIRLDGLNNEEISIPLTKIYDLNGKLINHATDYFMLDLSEKVKVGALVYKTKDTAYLESINKTYPAEFRRFPLTIIVKGQIGEVLHLYVNYEEYHVHVESDCLVEVAKTSSVTEANFKDLLAKLNDTPYYLDQLYVDFSNNAFIPLKVISNLKREAITKLNDLRLETSNIPKEVKTIQVPLLEVGPRLTVQVQNEEQYAAVKALGIKDIYYQNIVPRNNAKYPSFSDVVLVGGLGGVNHYAKTNDVVTDYSLNVVNATTLAMLYNLGVKRVTLSYENNKDNIQALIADFKKQYNQTPPVEVIAYGRQNLMVTKYCPLKRLNMCGKCKTNQFSLKDDFADFPLKFNDDCSITIWNSRILNLVDDLDGLQDVTIRLVFTTEDSETMKAVIGMFKDKINNPNSPTKYFNQATDTRGYFYKEIA